MENPWIQLPDKPPYVLEHDADLVLTFNRRVGLDENHRLQLELFPEPYLGDPSAPVVLLNSNPAFRDGAIERHRDPAYSRLIRKCLRHDDLSYPFFPIDPEVVGEGHAYWTYAFAPLFEQGLDLQTIARSVFTVEFFPYRSKKFAHRRLTLPSQQYSYSLVRAAVERGATILVMRKKGLWDSAVPQLKTYSRTYYAKLPFQKLRVSSANFPDKFSEIVDVLRKARH